jgi:hypothetical protein
MTTFKFCELISNITVKKLTPNNEKLVARIMQFVNGEVK